MVDDGKGVPPSRALTRARAATRPPPPAPPQLRALPASLRPWAHGRPVHGVPSVEESADDIILPPVNRSLQRSFKHRRAMHYNRLIGGFLFANLVLLAYGVGPGGWWTGSGARLSLLSAIAQANLVIAMLPRQHWMVNLGGAIATRPSTTLPLRLR